MMRIVLSRAWAALAVWCPPTLPKLMHKQTANDNLAERIDADRVALKQDFRGQGRPKIPNVTLVTYFDLR